MRVHAIQTGTVAVKAGQVDGGGHRRRSFTRLFADRRWTEPLPILAWLIEHPEGLIVVDTDTQSLMLDGRSDGVAPKPSQAVETLTRIQRLVAERPTVYLPSHDSQSPARLAARQTVSATHAIAR
jgi:hypothetical protein